jgi:hypothetical protein
METFLIFHGLRYFTGHLVFIKPFAVFCGYIFGIFVRLGMFYQEKSGNRGCAVLKIVAKAKHLRENEHRLYELDSSNKKLK